VVVSWTAVDHPSAIYHAKENARLRVTFDNLTGDPFAISGEILFGPRPAPQQPFQPLAAIPMTRSTLAPGDRAQIPVDVTFGGAGTYELRLRGVAPGKPDASIAAGPAAASATMSLECIFAPRVPALRDDSPWITTLPHSSLFVSGFLGDYISQTSVHRFLIDERFSFDSRANIGLGFGASWATSVTAGAAAEGGRAGGAITTRDIDALLEELLRAKAALTLRVSVPTIAPDERTLAGFRAYLVDALHRSHGALRAIVIAPDTSESLSPAQRAAFRSYYLAGYEAAKRQDRNLLLLGAGSAQATLQTLADLTAYIDAFAITDAASQPAQIRALENEARRKPLWILPPPIPNPWPLVPAPATLAQGAAVVPLPPPQVDRGVSAHLLGSAVLFQRIHLAVPNANPADPPPASELPYIVVVQGDRYALAAVAGLSANSPIDALFPALAHTRTIVDPVRPDGKPPYPSLEVGDDTHSMRVVDGQGNPVDCRIGGGGDSIFVPAADQFTYILQAGSADELAGSLRPSTPNRLPAAEITVVRTRAGEGPELLLKVRNITSGDLAGKLRLIVPGASPSTPPRLLAQTDVATIPPGKILELPLDLGNPAEIPPSFLAELTTTTSRPVIQRTALILPQ
jgi:hypothetical protein